MSIRAPIELNLQHPLNTRNEVVVRQHGTFRHSCRPGSITHQGHIVRLSAATSS